MVFEILPVITATNNPVGCSHSPKYKSCQKDPTGQPMRNLLPGRTGNKQWTEWLDIVADVCEGVAPTPILFRPFQENYLRNWWGSPYCSPAEFKAGWQYTVSSQAILQLLVAHASYLTDCS
jgi:hypothetical protein